MARARWVHRGLLLLAVIVVVVLVVGAGTGIILVRRPLPDRSGEAVLATLDGPVTVLRDQQGVPQVYADTAADLFRAQGYLHAQDRFFQMDLRRHVTAGRLGELVGPAPGALASDRLARTLGWRRVTEAELPLLDPSTRAWLDAYAEGVNAYLSDRSPSELSVSYTVLGLSVPLRRIESWSAVDSLAWFKTMAWSLRHNYADELARARLLNGGMSPRRVAQLWPAYPAAQHPPIVTTGSVASPGRPLPAAGPPVPTSHPPDPDAASALASAGSTLAAVTGLGEGAGLGSNSWVVSGERTSSGKPLLADDPHLTASQPGPWYQVGLHCRTQSPQCPFDVTGFGAAGTPGVLIGHNDSIAWGVSSLPADVTDLYLEQVTGDSYLRDGKQVPLASRVERIRVAGGREVVLTVRSTAHGPLVSDIIPEAVRTGDNLPLPQQPSEETRSYAVSLAWTGLSPGHAMDAVFALDQAHDWTTFRAAAALMDSPAQNLVYADTSGHIGYQAVGSVPVRNAGDGRLPAPGWLSAYDWKGRVPFAQLPAEQDPAGGMIVAANQQAAAGGPFLSDDWDYGYRAQRIRDLLAADTRGGRRLTVSDMRRIQADTRNLMAPVLVPLLLKVKLPAFSQEAQELLRGWDYTQPTDSAAAAYYNAVWTQVLSQTFDDDLREAFADGGDRWFAVVTDLLKRPNDPFWDRGHSAALVETRDEILSQALQDARAQLTVTLGKDPRRWQWGNLHRLQLQQRPFESRQGPIGQLFDVGPAHVGGGTSAVDAVGWDAHAAALDADYSVTTLPSMRMVVDLGDLDGSRWVNPTGASEHPTDAHRTDQLRAWVRGEQFAWPFRERAARARTEEELRLVPQPDS